MSENFLFGALGLTAAKLKAAVDAAIAAKDLATQAQVSAALSSEMTTFNRVTRRAVLVYAGADLVWTYPEPFDAGVVPIVEGLVVGAANGTALLNWWAIPPTYLANSGSIKYLPQV